MARCTLSPWTFFSRLSSPCLGCVLLIWIIFRVVQFRPHNESLRVVAALILAIIAVGMDHLAVSSTEYYEGGCDEPTTTELSRDDSDAHPPVVAARPDPTKPPLKEERVLIGIPVLAATMRRDIDKVFRRLKPLLDFDQKTGDVSMKVRSAWALLRPGASLWVAFAEAFPFVQGVPEHRRGLSAGVWGRWALHVARCRPGQLRHRAVRDGTARLRQAPQ
jgi:hypothetical protein